MEPERKEHVAGVPFFHFCLSPFVAVFNCLHASTAAQFWRARVCVCFHNVSFVERSA